MKRIFTGAARVTVLSLFIPGILLSLQTGCKSSQPTAAALKRLQGHWEGGGAGGVKCSITISGNSLHFYSRPDFWYKTTFTLPAGSNPQQLRATIRDSAANATNDIGKVIVAIVKIEEGTLSLAVNQDPDGPPPDAFPDDPNGVIARYDLKKVPQKKNAQASISVNHPSDVFKIASGRTMRAYIFD